MAGRRFRWNWLLAILIGWAGIGLAVAADMPQYRVSTWRSAQGLPHSSVSALFQDRDGYLWVGTYLGAARFDGVRFQSLAELTGGRANIDLIEDITQTPDGALWFGGAYRGLMRLDPQGRLTRFDRDDGLPASPLTILRPHPEGGLWLGTRTGLYHARIDADRVQGMERELERVVWDLAQASDGTVYAATESGPWRRTPDGWRLATSDARIARAHMWSMAFDAAGRGWAGMRGGLAKLGPDGFAYAPEATALPSPVVREVMPDVDGLLWVATSGGGVSGLGQSGRVQVSREYGLGSNVVWELLRDREGAIWAGTALGLSRISRAEVHAFDQRDGLPQALAWVVTPRQAGGWWLGFNEGGLIAFDGNRPIGTEVTALPAAASAVLSVVDRGTVQWIGTVTGLFMRRADGSTEEIPRFAGQRIHALLSIDPKTLLVGTDSGLWRLSDGTAEQIELPGAPRAAVSRIRPDGPGRWLVAVPSAGLFRIDGRRAEFVLQVPGGGLRDALRAPDGRLWLAAIGLFVSDPDQVRPIAAVNGTLPVQFHALELDATGRLWASTNAGVLRVALAELDRYLADPATPLEFTMFGEADGMHSSECNGQAQNTLALGPDGAAWVATTEGIVRIPATANPRHAPLPRPRIERVVVDGVTFTTPPPTFAAGTRQVEIDYTALRLTDADRLRFRYRLLPALSTWNEVGERRSVAFDALAPGSYRFEAQVGTATEAWGAPVALAFDVAPHWWERTDVRLLAAALTLLLVAAIPLLRMRTLRARARMLQSLVRTRTQELERANEALEQAASHDFLTGLPNRRAFVAALGAALEDARPLALAMLDIDHFKAYNDSLGHVAGDRCLTEFGRLLTDIAARPGVEAARIGGEEFALLFEGNAVERAPELLDALRADLRGRAMPHPASPVEPLVTFSAGLAVREAGDATPEALLGRADEALYRAKTAGRNRWLRAE